MDGKKSPTTKPGNFSDDLIVRSEKIYAEAREQLRVEEERLAPPQTNTEEQKSSKQNISEAQARRPASNAPAPISPVGAGWRPPRPKPTRMPLGWEGYCPIQLIPQTEKIFTEAVRKFPEQTQITQVYKYLISELTPLFCGAVQGKTLRADLALSSMKKLIWLFLYCNCDGSLETDRREQEMVKSDEWKKFVDEVARVHSAAVKDSSNIKEPLGLAPAQPSPEIVANGGGRERAAAEQQMRGSPQSSGAGAATWDTIEISFLSDERIQIYNGTDTNPYNYAEFGFADSRNGKPNQAWVTLRDLAEAKGIILINARRVSPWPKVEKRIQEIRKALRDHFGITSDPFLFKEGIGYQARFKIGVSPSFHT